jgi:hypothetical protein
VAIGLLTKSATAHQCVSVEKLSLFVVDESPMSFDSTSRVPGLQQPANSSSVEAGHGRRLYERFPIDTQLQICWEEAKGAHRQIRARAIDVSKLGVQVESERAIATGTVVNVFTASFGPIGRASVRHCTQHGMGYRLGLYMPDRFVDDL